MGRRVRAGGGDGYGDGDGDGGGGGDGDGSGSGGGDGGGDSDGSGCGDSLSSFQAAVSLRSRLQSCPPSSPPVLNALPNGRCLRTPPSRTSLHAM